MVILGSCHGSSVLEIRVVVLRTYKTTIMVLLLALDACDLYARLGLSMLEPKQQQRGIPTTSIRTLVNANSRGGA